MATQYDPHVIQRLADQLYKQAEGTIIIWTFVLLTIGASCGLSIAKVTLSSASIIYIIVGALIGALLGFVFGQSRAFSLRVQAQIALCQKQIEENSRP